MHWTTVGLHYAWFYPRIARAMHISSRKRPCVRISLVVIDMMMAHPEIRHPLYSPDERVECCHKIRVSDGTESHVYLYVIESCRLLSINGGKILPRTSC